MSKRVLEQAPASLLVFLLVVASVVTGVSSRKFTITNKCGYTVWPGILSSSGSSPLEPTGFSLSAGESRTVHAPHKWSGRIWARTHCATDSAGRFSCATGNCGSGQLECAGHGATPPATLAEFTLDGHEGLDFYDVSLVDGYNQPVLVEPEGAAVGPTCVATGCMVDLNGVCPAELRVAQGAAEGGVACKSACEAFGSPEHCCSGAHGGPDTCKPSQYSQFFKSNCPRAYSYAYDDATSTFTCGGGETSYTITFCPSTATVKRAESDPKLAMYIGNWRVGSSSASATPRLQGSSGLVFVLLGISFLAQTCLFY